jgi:hypothetical protein
MAPQKLLDGLVALVTGGASGAYANQHMINCLCEKLTFHV